MQRALFFNFLKVIASFIVISGSFKVLRNYRKLEIQQHLIRSYDKLGTQSSILNMYRPTTTSFIPSTLKRQSTAKPALPVAKSKKFVRIRIKNISDHTWISGKLCTKEKNRKIDINKKLESKFSGFELGGEWAPADSNITANSSWTAVLIPFLDREEHLLTWLEYMIPYLQEQKLHFRIFVIEQGASDTVFNKGILYNAGFLEANNIGNFDCFILHDVDLVAENMCNSYRCEPSNLVHLSSAVNTLNYGIPYGTLVGGVTAIQPVSYRDINGFSNTFFGWGGEDDEFSARLNQRRHTISRSNPKIGRYTMMEHTRDTNMNRSVGASDKHGKSYWHCDGLNSVQYKVTSINYSQYYTRLVIDFAGPKSINEAREDLQTEV